VDPFEIPDAEPSAARAADLVSDLVQPARSGALEKLGDGRQALAMGRAWVRAKFEPIESLADRRILAP
jgi:hypothetical protein